MTPAKAAAIGGASGVATGFVLMAALVLASPFVKRLQPKRTPAQPVKTHLSVVRGR